MNNFLNSNINNMNESISNVDEFINTGTRCKATLNEPDGKEIHCSLVHHNYEDTTLEYNRTELPNVKGITLKEENIPDYKQICREIQNILSFDKAMQTSFTEEIKEWIKEEIAIKDQNWFKNWLQKNFLIKKYKEKVNLMFNNTTHINNSKEAKEALKDFQKSIEAFKIKNKSDSGELKSYIRLFRGDFSLENKIAVIKSKINRLEEFESRYEDFDKKVSAPTTKQYQNYGEEHTFIATRNAFTTAIYNLKFNLCFAKLSKKSNENSSKKNVNDEDNKNITKKPVSIKISISPHLWGMYLCVIAGVIMSCVLTRSFISDADFKKVTAEITQKIKVATESHEEGEFHLDDDIQVEIRYMIIYFLKAAILSILFYTLFAIIIKGSFFSNFRDNWRYPFFTGVIITLSTDKFFAIFQNLLENVMPSIS